MTIRTLPEIEALDLPSALNWELPDEAVARWDDSVRAADEADDDTISLYGVVGRDFFSGADNTERRIAAALRKIGKRPVTVNVNSPGGDFLQGVAIYNLLREHPAEVTVKVMAMAGSAASIIAMAGDEIRIPKSGFIMVHDASAVALGNRHVMKSVMDILTEIDASMAEVYAARAEVKPSEAAAWMDKDSGKGTLFRGEAAIKAGLADKLLAADEMKAEASTEADDIKAEQVIERALMAQGISRRERRSLIGELLGRQAVAGGDRQAVAGDLAADLRGLISTLTP